MPDKRARATVTIRAQALWRIRLARELPRYTLGLLSLVGLAASARFAIAPPTPALPAAAVREPVQTDPAAEAYAVLFARRYLTWNAAEPQASVHALEAFLGPGMETAAGLELPASGSQHVEWAEVVQAREPAPGEHVYTVAAQTDSAGLLYLTVPVVRTISGALALAGYPAFVGAPATESARLPAQLREVDDPALATVIRRVLRNYLAASSSELAADLTGDAHVSLPEQPLTLDSMQRLDWAPEGSAVLAIVQAQDERGVHYTLAYEMNVERAQGRWEVSAVQMEPNA
ncbi:MAG TPA: conjugal transfer protein [Solirubrobacteraceae bacterium]|nr:conjugal transfer protein [Solirubrobacteraceae bacterium]